VLQVARAHVKPGEREEVTAIPPKPLGSADSEEKYARIQNVLKEVACPLQALLAGLLIWLNPAPVRRASRFACLLALA
jgi:hypothetical protein